MDNSIGIGDLATIITVAGITVYVLGLVGLAITISQKFTGDLSAAWYAASLLPRTIVAGQGVRIWLGLPIVLTVVLFLVTHIIGPQYLFIGTAGAALLISVLLTATSAWIAYKRGMVQIKRRPEDVREALEREVQVEDLWERRIHRLEERRIDRSLNRIAVLITLFVCSFFCVPGALVMAYANLLVASPLECPASTALIPVCNLIPKNGDNFVIGTVLLFVGSFIVGLPTALWVRPPFPQVIITRKSEANVHPQTPQHVQGHLVTHRDGFWHLFDEDMELLSIPDEQVSAVRTVRKTDTTPVDPVEAVMSTEEPASAEDTKLGEEKDTQPPPH